MQPERDIGNFAKEAWAIERGARCDLCPLAGTQRGPVLPSIPDNMHTLVVAEAPGHTEIAKGEVLIGASGKEIRGALAAAGADMSRVGFTNAAMCAPDIEMKKHIQLCRKMKVPNAIECCKPRLQREIAQASFVVLMGGASLTAAGVKDSIMALRGTPVQIPGGPRALPVLHAAFVLRDEGRVHRPLFHADVRKAVRISHGGDTWREPPYFVPRTSDAVDNFLRAQTGPVSVDVETDGVDPWTCNIRRVGIGTDAGVMIYSPLSVKGHKLLADHEITAQSRAIAAHVGRAPRMNLHNGIAYDSVVMWRHQMPLNDGGIFDTMVGHQVGYTSELPHRLDFLGSMYTDAPFWKNAFKHSEVKDDAILDKYLSFDVAVTHLAAPYVEANLKQSGQEHIYTLDAELFRIGRSMAMLGLQIDREKQFVFAKEYQDKADRLTAEFKAYAGSDVNPNSVKQVKDLLYHTLGLPQLDQHITESGEPSTDEPTLLDLLGLGLDHRATKVIHALLGVREAEKILGTNTGHVVDGQIVGGPPLHGDGRLRTTWRPGKTSGRWGSSDPVNLQNIPNRLRSMFTPAPGNVFVAADMSAVELRKIALLAGDEPLIEAFRAFDEGRGPDVHIYNACNVFKCTPEQVTKEIRDFIKRYAYATAYDAQPPTIYRTLSLLRDENLNPKFPHITLAEVERVFGLWWQLHPAIPAWKKRLLQGWRSRGYIETAYHKRRRFFIGGENAAEMGNFPVQGGCADMQNEAIRGVVQLYPYDFARHRGLVINGHDQIVVECGADEVDRVKGIIESCMAKRIGPMLFPAVAKPGASWKDVS